MTINKVFSKDPDSKLDYEINWVLWLDGDTISESSWEVPSGLTGSDESNTTNSATIFISGGSVGKTYDVVNSIVTTIGREVDRTIKIKIEER